MWPPASVQTCVVHLIRASLRFCSYKDRKAVARDLKPIYKAVNVDEAALMLEAFDTTWGGHYPGDRQVCA